MVIFQNYQILRVRYVHIFIPKYESELNQIDKREFITADLKIENVGGMIKLNRRPKNCE